jgi:hypothetical protein
MSPVAAVIALSLAFGPPPPPPAPAPTTPVEPTPVEPTTPTPTEPSIPAPTIPGPTIQPGTPKRVTMPGTKGDPVVLPTPVAPTPVRPTPVLPTGPQPILPGADPDGPKAKPIQEEPQPRQRRKRERRPRGGAGSTDTAPSASGACFAPQSRCRTFVLAGVAMSASGLALGTGGAILASRPVTPVREDPTRVTSFRPPGYAMIGVGAGLIIAGVAVLAAGLASHRRDQSMRRTAWWRPRMSFGVILP